MFITLEGPEGSGKTTQARLLAEYLQKSGLSVHLTREPGGSSIGDQIRKILVDHANTDMHPRTEILLFLAQRAQHVEQIIRPQLADGHIVICDRYRDSTLAYQGFGHGLDVHLLDTLNDFATGGLQPDLTFLLDVDVEIGLARRSSGGGWNRLDAYQVAFHQRVRSGYHQLAEKNPARWIVIDASQPPDQVSEALQVALAERTNGMAH